MRFHPEGRSWIWGSLGVGGGLGVLFWLVEPPLPLTIATFILWGGWTSLVLNFFRYPSRVCPAEPDTIYAPCDGKVVAIQRTFEPKYFHAEMMQISIFMSPLDVHVNWAPAAGILHKLQYNAGAYMVAWHPKASLLNEQTFLAVESGEKRHYALRQIAGVLARRIRTYPQEGDRLEAGTEIGFIKFGSRIDVLLPLSVRIPIQVGQRVHGALTPIAYW